MQPTVADKFAAMLEKDPEDAKAKLLRDTYNEGLSHCMDPAWQSNAG